ncbi:MAG: hypothetical protein HOB51_00595 [Thaumarchaeota archaeon]|nr:hypothetical protein [Nitrososphaerota archaeon]
MSTLENINQYEITPTHLDRIADLVEKKRFKNQDHFIDRAIEVFLAWETNPPKAMEEMMKIEPTIAQYSHMIMMGMEYAQLKIMYPRHPEKFGREWIDHLLDDETGLEEKFEKSKCIHDPQSDARASHKDYEHAIANKTDAGNFLKTLDFSKSIENSTAYVYDDWPLLFAHYSRLFPAKVGILSLAELMRNNNNIQINFEKFTEKAFDLCEEISEKQIKRETKESISREHKLSTGLPKPFKKDITDSKQQEYQNRYKEKYFGKLKRNRKDGKQYFEGLMSSLGLIKFFKIDGENFVTLTEKGKDFFLLENPILDGDFEIKPFSDDEVKYILKNLVSERQLEVNLMAGALRLIESKIGMDEDIIHQLDEVFQIIIQEYCDSNKKDLNFNKLNDILLSTEKITMDIKTAKKELKTDLDKESRENAERRSKKQTPIQAIRVATMGRMSELNLVKWNIDGGKSFFTLGASELVKIIKKQAK